MANDYVGNGGNIPRWAYDRLEKHDRQLDRLAPLPDKIDGICQDIAEIKASLNRREDRDVSKTSQQTRDQLQREGLHLTFVQAIFGSFIVGVGFIGTILYVVGQAGARIAGH